MNRFSDADSLLKVTRYPPSSKNMKLEKNHIHNIYFLLQAHLSVIRGPLCLRINRDSCWTIQKMPGCLTYLMNVAVINAAKVNYF